ncbi:HEAT repeat domain-containing protein [Nocardia sp. NPDC023852]|uniref:HEAT repeat domain-containing protein n=1 Tax=Nocardia sp. NPDC023852 TaxID=3154697 RepID=UPI0034052719
MLGLPALNKAAFYAEQIRSANVAARRGVVEEIGRHGATDYAFVLTVLLGDIDEQVRGTAAKSFGEFGAQMIPLLQQVRRSNLPERRGALDALAEIGWHTIAPADLALLHRFIMSKLAHERPQPIPAAKECLWWALPTDNQAAVLDAFGLSDPVPATVAMGSAVALDERRRPVDEECQRVYVSPALDGWTLVFGDPASHYPRDEQRIRELQESDFWKTIMENEPDAIKQAMLSKMSRPSREERCAELSGRFGAAPWYKEAGDYESGGWCIAGKR